MQDTYIQSKLIISLLPLLWDCYFIHDSNQDCCVIVY